MSMDPGTRIGSFEIRSLIGAGGMGEVYRARDTKLKRDVALKVLPEMFASDPDRMARFQREAEVLASLNHPNIAQIYGVENKALVMELVEGDSPKGPMAFDDAWEIVSQIAGALEYAHASGVIHRDLKPANVKVTPQGVVKLLDFGLAKAFNETATGSARDFSNSPTLTMSSVAGAIIGTASYMSPEQARGKPVDKRADIWAFGVVLYELITGRRPFGGADVSEILASVIKDEPDWEAAGPKVQRLLRKCLTKDPQQRLRDIGDAAALLEEAAPTTRPVAPKIQRSKLPLVLAAVATLAALVLGYTSYRNSAGETARTAKLSMAFPVKMIPARYGVPAVSPDGRRIAFVASIDGTLATLDGQLWVRDLDDLTSRPLAGTERATFPFWSPNGKFIGFFQGGKLKTIDPSGAPPITLCDAPQPKGGTWNDQDVIVFGSASSQIGLRRIPAKGGSASELTHIDSGANETSHQMPWFLPDGRHYLYTAVNQDVRKSVIYVDDLDAQDHAHSRRPVLTAYSNAVYSAGHLLFVLERTLMAQRFDTQKLATLGDLKPIGEQLNYLPGGVEAAFSASPDGTLAYAAGDPATEVQLTWFDRSGKVTGSLGPPASQLWPAISPDDSKVAIDRRDHPRTSFFELWLFDLKQGASSRFTFNADSYANQYPIWSPDGHQIAFSSSRSDKGSVFLKTLGATEPDELLDHDSLTRYPTDWSRDGRYIIEEVTDPKTKKDIWVLPLSGDRKSFPYLHSAVNEERGKLSPSGLWLAYASDETGQSEIYIQSFPTPGGKRQISTGQGGRPIWSRDGKELYYYSRDGQTVMAVSVNSNSTNFDAGIPHALFDARQAGSGSWFDVSKEGRFLIPLQPEASVTPTLTVVLNWAAGLKD